MRSALLVLFLSAAPACAQVLLPGPVLPGSPVTPVLPTTPGLTPGLGTFSPTLSPAPMLSLPNALPQVAAPKLQAPGEPMGAVEAHRPVPDRAAEPVSAVPAIPAQNTGPVSAQRAASKEELAFVAKAAAELAVLADNLGAERGMKSSKMTGKDFLDLLEGGQLRYAELFQEKAPTPEAFAAAQAVQEHLARLVRAMLKPGEPLNGQVRKVLAVWNVFNQELDAASEKGTLEAVEAEAKLFADQVEQSV